MINDYSILFRGMSDGTTKFHYSLNSNTEKSIIMKVYNQYLEYVEYESTFTLQPGVNYWTSVHSNLINRYVEFRDANTFDIVGMFGLDGEMDYHNIPYSSYIKSIVPSLDYNGKKDMHYILNEIFYQKVYNNDFVCVAENDIVFDIGFNYGFFTLDALTYKPKKIIGFEPNPNLVKLFNRLHIDSVELHQSAVSNKEGSTIFYENNFSGKSSIHSDVNADTKLDSYNVNICSFNDMAEQYDVIDYLKVDCEGAEYEIFESMTNEFLTNRIRKIALEFHHNINDIKVVNLISKIKECGFETKIDYKDGDSTGMLYARK
jgi:FkbM family methyltransferase